MGQYYCKPIDVKIDDDNTGISLVFEMQIRMNEFDHCVSVLLKQC